MNPKIRHDEPRDHSTRERDRIDRIEGGDNMSGNLLVVVSANKLNELRKILPEIEHEHADGMNECSICDEEILETVIKELTRLNKLKENLDEILEDNHQALDNGCPWCGSDEYPVNEKGEPVQMAEDANEWRCDHDPDCAVSKIEEVLKAVII